MAIRIKPKIDLGPCILTLKSIEDITLRISNEFPDATFSASDYIWEIIDEPRNAFIKAISEREKLDEFVVSVKVTTKTNVKKNGIEEMIIIFNQDEATVSCKAHPDQKSWFEHLLIDLERCILKPDFSQRMAHVYRNGKWNFSAGFGSLLAISLDDFSQPTKNPYVRILIKQNPPNPFTENIKANLVSNLIWFILGAILLLIAQWFFRTYGIDINPFD